MKNIIVESYRRMSEVYSPVDTQPTQAEPQSDVVDTITLDVPLMIRMVEMGREELQDDEQLHRVIENLVAASHAKQGEPLTMDDYDAIVQGEEEGFKQEPEDSAEQGSEEVYQNY